MGISLDCHGQSPRNDAEIATSRADSRNDIAGILLYTRVGTEDGGGSVCVGILLYTRVVEGREVCGCGCAWVILNKVKNLVISVIVSALTLSDPSTALRYAQDDKHSLRSWVGFYLPV